MNTRTLATLAAAALAATAFALEPEDREAIRPKGPADTPVLLIGDSMMRILGIQSEKAFKKAGIEPVAAFSSLGSGLVRSSVFNWSKKIDELFDEHKPKTVFVALGTNDRQALELPDGSIVPYQDAAKWREGYSALVGGVMDQCLAREAELVVWLVPPDMNDAANQEHAQLIADIVVKEALKENRKGKVQVLDLAQILSVKPGTYSQYKMDPATGGPLSVRDPDGVHLSVDGAKLVARALIRQYFKKK